VAVTNSACLEVQLENVQEGLQPGLKCPLGGAATCVLPEVTLYNGSAARIFIGP
jgi:hypothetical protein